jgi:murein L,D-transpeptidase YcbB/YkuD
MHLLAVVGRRGHVSHLTGDRCDAPLEQARQRFQERLSTDAVGVVGSSTFVGLQVSAAGRVRQLALKMERWLPYELEKGSIVVHRASGA